MDLNAIKKKLADSNAPKGKKFEKIDYSKIYFKPKKGKTVIRVVPSKFNKQDPFKELYMHYGYKPFPIVSLKSFGEKDPIDEFAQSLFKGSDKQDWELGKKLKSKQRVFLPVIERGEEDKGVRLWEFGTGMYKKLMAIAADEDYGDFTDILEGFDFTLEGTDKESFGKTIIDVDVRPKPKTSKLSEDEAEAEKWLNEQPNPEDLFKRFSFDELKDILQNFLEPKEDESETVKIDTIETGADEALEEKTTVKTKAGTAKGAAGKAKASNADKFDDLFDSEK